MEAEGGGYKLVSMAHDKQIRRIPHSEIVSHGGVPRFNGATTIESRAIGAI